MTALTSPTLNTLETTPSNTAFTAAPALTSIVTPWLLWIMPLIYSWGPKAIDTVPDTGHGRCPLFFSKFPERCISASEENTVLEPDLIVFNEAAGTSAPDSAGFAAG